MLWSSRSPFITIVIETGAPVAVVVGVVAGVVAGALDYDAESNAFVLPRLGVSGLVVPEPAPLAAIGLGLAALAGARSRAGRGPR